MLPEARRIRSEFYQRVWSEAAANFGATIELLGYDIFEIRRDGKRTRVRQNYTSLDDCMTLAVAGNKPLTQRLLVDSGLRVPCQAEFALASPDPAIEFLQESTAPCVVKPAAHTGGGRGVTTGIRSRAQLRRAAAAATMYGSELLIQRQVRGRNYRLLYLDGRLLDAVVQSEPTVTADGRTTIKTLVERANCQRLKQGAELGQGLLTVDLEMRHTLSAQGLGLSSVPPSGRSITLKIAINENSGGDNQTVTHLLCEEVIEDGARAARAIGARLAGVDIITTDPGIALSESGGAIIEVNTTPGFYWHYHKRGSAFPVAEHVLSRLFGRLTTLHGDGSDKTAVLKPDSWTSLRP